MKANSTYASISSILFPRLTHQLKKKKKFIFKLKSKINRCLKKIKKKADSDFEPNRFKFEMKQIIWIWNGVPSTPMFIDNYLDEPIWWQYRIHLRVAKKNLQTGEKNSRDQTREISKIQTPLTNQQ